MPVVEQEIVVPPGKRLKYGMFFSDKWNALDIELYCFRTARPVEKGGLGKEEHFWNVVSYLWGPKNAVKNRTKIFIRNPWSEKIIHELCNFRYVAIGGCAGSTKSETCALYLLVTYLSDYRNVLGIMLSTSLKEAKKRIWSSLTEFIRAIPKPGLPLKIVDSQGIIRFVSKDTIAPDNASISLIAAERKQEKEAIGKLIGMHNKLVIVVADELSELTPSILEYALPGGNLTSNPNYQFIGLSNPASYFDPFAVVWKPKAGWTSISVEDERWETEYGIGLHFDGMKSPNILAGKVLYPFLPTAEKIAEARDTEGGETSLRFWRMIRGFMCPTGQEATVYDGTDIIAFKGDTPAIWGDEPLTRVAFLDPGFTNGGDKTWLKFGNYGKTKDGDMCLCYDKEIELVEDVTNKEMNRSYQIAHKLKKWCEDEKVLPANCGIDATGAGSPFCDVVDVVWSKEVYRCKFGGNASDLPASQTDPVPGYDRYYDRVTELWYIGKELLRNGQLRGITPEMGKQMTARLYGTTGAEKKIYVESKEKMKLRTGGHSPDNADAGFGLIDLCRKRLGFGPKRPIDPKAPKASNNSWRNLRKRFGNIRSLPINLRRG